LRFKNEIEEYGGEISRLRKSLGMSSKKMKLKKSTQSLSKFSSFLFETWKMKIKEIEKLQNKIAKQATEEIGKPVRVGKHEILVGEIPGSMDETVKTAGNVLFPNRAVVIFGKNKNISVVGMRGKEVNIDMGAIVKEICGVLGGGGGGKPDFGRGSGNKDKLQEAIGFAGKRIKEELEK
jgi:alanyl-tRNA synthetase